MARISTAETGDQSLSLPLSHQQKKKKKKKLCVWCLGSAGSLLHGLALVYDDGTSVALLPSATLSAPHLPCQACCLPLQST